MSSVNGRSSILTLGSALAASAGFLGKVPRLLGACHVPHLAGAGQGSPSYNTYKPHRQPAGSKLQKKVKAGVLTMCHPCGSVSVAFREMERWRHLQLLADKRRAGVMRKAA